MFFFSAGSFAEKFVLVEKSFIYFLWNDGCLEYPDFSTFISSNHNYFLFFDNVESILYFGNIRLFCYTSSLKLVSVVTIKCSCRSINLNLKQFSSAMLYSNNSRTAHQRIQIHATMSTISLHCKQCLDV